jgi:hypothetical protein
VLGGESFEALAAGLQNALWQLGGVPLEHRTDSLSAAFRNLNAEAAEDLTRRYEALCAHYGMRASRNNPGASHENGAIEARQGTLKDRLDQALLLRGTRRFASVEEYREFVGESVVRLNARVGKAFAIEGAALRALPMRRTAEYEELQARVTKFGTFSVRGVLYSAPSRLIGHRLKVRLYSDRLECFLSGALVLRLTRGARRGRVIDYRHFVDALKRKPQAFKGLLFRDALFPREAYRRMWEQLDLRLSRRQACQTIVALLEMAAHDGVEGVLAQRLNALLAAGELPDLKKLREEFAPSKTEIPLITVVMPTARSYDTLLPSKQLRELEVTA